MPPRRGAANWLSVLLVLGLAGPLAAADGPCNLADEFLDPTKNYEYVYNGTVDIRHTAGSVASTAGFSFTCVAIINGEQPCYHSLQLSNCYLDDRADHADAASRHHSFNRLLRRGHVHFRLVDGQLDEVFADPEEAAFITNVRRGVLGPLRVSRALLDRTGRNVDGRCERTVTRLGAGRHRVERSRGCDPAHNVPSVRSPFSPLPSLGLLEDRFSVSSVCDYETTSSELKHAVCKQTWQLNQPSADDVQVVVTQDLRLETSGAAGAPLERNAREAGAALQLEDSDRYIDVGDSSVFGRLKALVATSVPLMTPETPQRFTDLLRALRRKYESPLQMADTCTDCTSFEKAVMEELSETAVLQCGSAPCLRQVASMVRSGRVTGDRLTPLYLTWHWNTIRDEESAHTMLSLCELAPTRWCLLGLAAALRRTAAAGSGGADRVADRLRRTAADMIGPRCRGADPAVLMALKTLSNMGDLALDDFATLGLVRTCLTDPSRPVMIATEAVRTLSVARLPPKFAGVLKDVFQDEKHALITRQLAYLTFLSRFPSERSYRLALRWATSQRADALSSFVLRHWKQMSLSHPQHALTRRLAAEHDVDLANVPDALFNSVSASTVREFRLGQWLQMALPTVPASEAGVQLWRLHGASFLPHVLYLNTTLRLAGGGWAPLALELRAVGLERFVHELVRDPEFDLSTARGVLRELASAAAATFGSRFGGASFVASLDEADAPERLRLAPDVTAWLRSLLQAYQARAAAPDGRPRAVLTVSVMGSQVAYLTAEDVISRLETPDPPAEPYHILGQKLFHSETVFKFLEGQHRLPLAVGLPLELFADGTVAAGAAAEVSSRLGQSYRNMTEMFNGDAQLSASAGISLVVGLEVALPPFARAGLQLNTTLYAPFSLNVSYAIVNRTVQLTAPKPDRKRTLLLLSHGAQLRQGGEVQPSPAADSRTSHCVPQAIYTGLLVCREFRHSGRLGFTAPFIYHVTGENPDPEFHTYALDVWTSSRLDGYEHGGMFHLFLHRPAAGAADLRLHVGFRLMPINFNPALFHSGQKANTTFELLVGDEAEPLWRLYFIRAYTDREDLLYSETRGWVINKGVTLFSADAERHRTLPWLTAARHRDDVSVRAVFTGQQLTYSRRYLAAGRPGGDADLSAELRYQTVYRNTAIERLIAPQFYDTGERAAWLRLNYSRRLTANDELTELNWSHTASAATPGVTLAGLLNLTSTADSSARLVANLTSQETGSGRVLMYTSATGQYNRDREGAAVTDRLQASLSCPSAAFDGRLRLETRPGGRLTTNASLERRGGWRGRLTAALEPAAPEPGRRLTASLHLPGDELRLTGQFSAPARPRPWLSWYRDDYSFSQSSRLWWSRYDTEVTSSLEAANSSAALRVAAELAVSRPAVRAAVNLDWDKQQRLWDSDVWLASPALRFNSSVVSSKIGGVGMERSFTQSSASPMWDILDHELEGTVRTDCLNCSSRLRDTDLKLRHKWLRLRSSASRQLADAGAEPAAGLRRLAVQLDSAADFLPSMTCALKPEGDFTMSLTLPAMGPPPKVDVKYSLQPPSRWKKVFVRSLDVEISDGRAGRPVPALHVSLETTPGDPSRLAAELELQPSAWLAAGSAVAQRLQMTAAQARRALLDPEHRLNRLLRPLTGAPTLVDWVKRTPARLSAAGSWLAGRVAALLSPWKSITAPVYETAKNMLLAARDFLLRATAGLRQRANELYRRGADQVAHGPSLKERVLGLLPPQMMGQLMQRLNQLMVAGLQRLPFKMERTVRGSRTRVELTDLPDYANVQTIWNITAVARARLQQPSVLSELLARPDDRRPLAALWRDGRALALDGRSFMLPAVDGCAHLLLADVEQRGFSVLRSARYLAMTFLDCNVLVNDRGQVHVERFNVSLPSRFRTEVRTEGSRLVARSSFGLQAEVDLGCGVTVFRLDPWMSRRTAGLLATAEDTAGWDRAAAWRQFGMEAGGRCPAAPAAAGPALEIDGCGRVETAECSRLTGLERAARQHRPLCAAPEPVPWQVSRSGPVGGAEPVRVLLAVADPAVGADTVRLLAETLHRQLAELGQRSVQYALVADGGPPARPVWVDSPESLQLEGSKLRSGDLVRTLHRAMTGRPFGGPAAHRVLVVFAPSDELRGGASLTGLRRQLWSRHVAVHLVTPLARYPLLELPVRGLTARGRVISTDGRRRLTLPEHQGDLGQLVAATSGAVWDSALLRQEGGAASAALLADAVWQRVATAEPGPPLPGSPSEDGSRRRLAAAPGAAGRPSAAAGLLLALLCLLPARLL